MMSIDVKTLPDDVTQLKQNIEDLLKKFHNMKDELHNQTLAYAALKEKYNLLLHHRFGKSSEKQADDGSQPMLFNEAELGFTEKEEEPPVEKMVKAPSSGKKRGRKPISKDLSIRRVEHDLPDEEKLCKRCHKERPRVSEKITREVEYIPARLEVVEHVYPVYGPCSCPKCLERNQPEMIQCPTIKRMIPGSIAGPGLLAQVITNKYVDSLPFYRQQKMFKRLDFDLSRETMCNWLIRTADKCGDLLELLWEESTQGPVVQMDETTVQVLKEKDRAPSTKSYMWVNIGYPDNKPVVLFHYHTGRSGKIPFAILKDYKGYLQTDGYAGYNAVGALPGIIHVGCFAHARRKFHEASKATKKQTSANVALSHIRQLYIIEEKLRKENLSVEDFVRKRKELALPKLERFHNWLEKKKNQVPPKSLIGSAVSYALGEWEKLVRYLDHWCLTPDNNRIENAIRPFVVGRKNWIFSDTPRGARSSALFYSFVETAKANGLEPYSYLLYLFVHLPYAKTVEEKRALLPHRVSAKEISSFIQSYTA